MQDLSVIKPGSASVDIARQGQNNSLTHHPVTRYLLGYKSPNSRRTMRCNLNLAVRSFYSRYDILTFPWEKLDDVTVNLMLNRVRINHEPDTVSAVRTALLGITKILWIDGLISERQYCAIKNVRPDVGWHRPRGRMVERGELKQIFDSLKESDSPQAARDACMIAFMTECGLRRAETAALRYENIDLDEQSFTIIGKRDKERICYIPPGAMRSLERYLTYRGDEPGPLFCSINRFGDLSFKGMTPQAVYFIVKRLKERLQLEDFSPHDLRRTFATVLLEQGEDLITVRDMMGHASVSTTQRYDKRGEKQKKRAALTLRLAS